eukprot:UN1666
MIMNMGLPRALYAFGVVAYYVVALAVFGASVQFHYRGCSPKREFLCWRCLDQSCCLALVIVGFFAGIPMGFHCAPWWQVAYTAQSLLVLAAMSVIMLVTPKENAGFLSTSMIVSALTALVPAVHWLLTSTEGCKAGGQSFLLCIVSSLLAIFFFSSYVPERLAPGRFDLLGSSHQLWHVFIFVAIVAYGDTLTAVFDLTGSAKFCT